MGFVDARVLVLEFVSPSGPSSDNPLSKWRQGCLLLTLALAGCASPETPMQRYVSSDDHVIDQHFGVRPSPRVVADGDEVPQGGGRYHVGKPYKIAGKTYVPSEKPYAVVGSASWYGADFHGRRTANGEIFDRGSFSAAHPTMPLPSYARVTNLRNAHSIVVRVNDRGPYHGGRVMDVSERVADALDFRSSGTANVKIEWLGRAELSGSNNSKLLASLRTDGQPANLEGLEPPVMVAERQAPTRTALNSPQSTRSDFDESGTRGATTNAVRRADRNDMNALAGATRGNSARMETDLAAVGSIHSSETAAPLPPARPFDVDRPNKPTPLNETFN